ncbi:tetratricopeptide repeat protein [Luteolibacter yonseiensis]|uniref:Tetratricopeptide repeat protein n=1 Tax=Luteolibacter yonseiensis TaxID=1144680 RepID=A0A934V9M4_9BACT|nr:tetratricopeptide repeat protein [Luteolibacter yonseiensis]MBK1815303.1 tetratricopeptide repeat protein [Luteolibacter yonseiensis]
MSSLVSNKPRPQDLAGLAFILLLVIACSWPGMHAPLFTDDIHQLERSKGLVSWADFWGTDVFGYYRPVKNALFKLLVPLEKNPVAWHWVGLACYLAATVAVHRIATICLGAGLPALLACCLWALSPSCVSTVIWLSSANISIGIVLFALVVHFHECSATRSSLRIFILCGVFFALALLCYESLIAIPALLFIRDLQQRRIGPDRGTVIRYAGYALVALAFLIVRHQFSARAIGGDNLNPGFQPDTKAYQMMLSAPWFLWRHFLMWAFPFGTIELLGSYSWLKSAPAASLVFGWVFLATLIATVFLTWKRFPAVGYGIAFFILASMPSGNFLPCFNGPIYDVYVTIPSIGLAIAVAAACASLVRQFLNRRREAASGAVAFLAVLSLLLIYRLPVCGSYFRYWSGVWGKPVELMLLTAETRPLQYQAKGFATILLLGEGFIGQAETLANEVVSEAPWIPTAKLTLARIAAYRKEDRKAEEIYRRLLGSPRESMFIKDSAKLELADILAKTPATREEAAQLCREVLMQRKADHTPVAVALLASIYKDQGNPAKAIATLERGLKLHPGDKRLAGLRQAYNHPSSDPPPERN